MRLFHLDSDVVVYNSHIIEKVFFRIFLKKIYLYRLIHSYNRFIVARSYYKSKLRLIYRWSVKNTENSNFYYDLEERDLFYLANLIAHVTNSSIESVEKYFTEILTDKAFRLHIEEGFRLSGYNQNVEVKIGRRVGWYAIARITKPSKILETGVDHGIGACVLTRALLLNESEGFGGSYFGTDIDLAAGQLLRDDYSRVGKILYGDSLKSLDSFNQKIDLFINDSDHSSDYEYLEYRQVLSKLSSTAIIIGDNAHVTDSLARFSAEESRHFLFFREDPKNHWYPGAGIGISFK